MSRIMLIDDEPDSRFILRHLLRVSAPAIRVEEFADGQAAVDHLAGVLAEDDAGRLPTLLLLDLHMPRVDGFEVLRWIQPQPALAPLIKVVVSSSDLPADIARARALGADSYLPKYPSPATCRALFAAAAEVARARAARLAPPEAELVAIFPQCWPAARRVFGGRPA